MDMHELRSLAAKKELSLNYIYKDLMISRALHEMQGNDSIILKGGTAANRIYLKDRKRFSEDIDFDYISDKSPKDAIDPLKKKVKNLKEFDIQKPRIMNNTIRFDLVFTNPLKMRDRIMLEFHLTETQGKHDKTIVNYGFVPYEASLLEVYGLDALFSQKINALVNRTEGKDYYDLFYLADICKKKVSKELYKKICIKIDKDRENIKSIANSTNHYIVKSLRPDWTDLIEKLRQKLES